MSATSGTIHDLLALDAVAQADLVNRREITPTELVTAAIERIEQLNPVLNAVVTYEFERALEAATRVPAGAALAGAPFLLKDLCVEWEGVRFTEGSAFLRDNVSGHDQELTRRLRRAGVALLGKTNTPEFGLLPTCEPALFGPARNPWDTNRTPGGSSGGSAAAVAAGMVPAAYGNDAGGSIRIPASCCGLLGLKPTRGRIPHGPEYGDLMSGFAAEFAVSPSVRDSAALLDVLHGPDVGDPYSAPPVSRPFSDEVGADPGRLRIGFTAARPDGGNVHPDCLAAFDDAVRLCADLGHEMVETTLPGLDEDVLMALGAWEGTAVAWIVDYWVRRLGRRPDTDEIEPATRMWWEQGSAVTGSQYLLAIGKLQAFSRTVARFFTDIDVWLTPTLAEPPVAIGEINGTTQDPAVVAERMVSFIGYPAWVANVTGNPAVSVPLHWSGQGLPIGVHFLGRFGHDATLIRLAAQLEQARPWSGRLPRDPTTDG